ncbi:MAG: type III secretion system export apparatus subunit SctV [Rhizobacter sp.]|nr:type III secretion system export apparatus subunit SctV [Rhizobacter sp.]
MATPSQSLPASGRLRGWFGVASRQNDLALAGLLVAIVALFVLPLPTPLLDLLIATNLAVSLVLLIVAMYVPSALSLSTFPSLLLFTTLFRLALNIASTKLILLHANAGHIIDTFGKLIVGNNVVVGAVVFLIIAIVQFIVIAKGSERVAEVAARFALDAMPGKQMSIDADVRAGVLSSAQAQTRRRLLEQECQLHGAMDGAMKFVKGDAIAGILIAIVNILAGIAIGTLMLDMSVGAAVQRFAILTVGDGMVSQIPSLLVSIAAGVVITRVGGAGGEGHDGQLAQQIGRQVLAHPRALIVAGLALASFLLVPGFPKWVFGLLALVVVGTGAASLALRRRRHVSDWISHPEAEGDTPAADHALAAPLALHLSQGLREAVDRYKLDQRLSGVKAALEAELGPVVPQLRIVYAATIRDPAAYEVLVQDVPVARGVLRPGWRLLDEHEAVAPPAGAELGEPFGPFTRVVWVPESSGAPGRESVDVIAAHVEHVVRRHAPQLIGLQEVQRLLHVVQRDAPDLAAEAARVVPLQRIVEVLRRLLQEGIPIRNLNAILEALVIWAPKEADTIALTELVRIAMGRYITSRYVGAERRLDAILFEASLLDRVQNAVERGPRGNLLLLSPAVTQEIREQVRRIVDAASGRVVAVTSSDVRRYVKTLLEPVVPQLVVLSYQEVDDDVALQPVGWIANPKAA